MPTTKIPSSSLTKQTKHTTKFIILKTKQKLRGMEEEEFIMGFNGQPGFSHESTHAMSFSKESSQLTDPGFSHESTHAMSFSKESSQLTETTTADKRSSLDPYFYRCFVYSQDARRVEQEMEDSEKMGIQSQKRQPANRAIKRKPEYQFSCYQNQNRMKGGPGANPFKYKGKAFDPLINCAVCVAESKGTKKPHRGHHPQCPKNRKTKGRKSTNDVYFDEKAKQLAAINGESFEGTFTNVSELPPETRECAQKMVAPQRTDHSNLHDAVRDAMADPEFVSSSSDKKTGAPLAIMAVVRHLVNHKEKGWYEPNTLEFKIPIVRTGNYINPHCHAIEGQVIYNVSWEDQFPGLQIDCPSCGKGKLRRDRTNFSKNKKLFAIFKLGTVPGWAIVMTYKCTHCGIRYEANDAAVLSVLPIHIRKAYPVDPKYADNTMTFHIDKGLSQILEELMLTYGNGDKVSKMIFNTLTKQYSDRFTEYLSEWKNIRMLSQIEGPTPLYPLLFGEFITTYPPSEETLRNLFESASKLSRTPYGILDCDRCTREIQSVTTSHMFAQDHTMEATKNYRKALGAHAVWDAATETGAAECLARRSGFQPIAMYSDTWPAKVKFWKLLFGDDFEGRLGLYHFLQRIIKTMRQGHNLYHKALTDLWQCVYGFEKESYNTLLNALKTGKMGRDGVAYTMSEILEMQDTPEFRRRFAKYLMKEIHPPMVIEHNLQKWFDQYKGSEDPRTGKKLFTVDTKTAVVEQMKNAVYIQDTVPLKDVYRVVKPTAGTKHECSEYHSLRCESKIEAYHDHLAHFGNCGMNANLCDALNLIGTAKYNVKIRHKLRMSNDSDSSAAAESVPMGWKTEPDFYNHCELIFANGLAEQVDYPILPFPFARPLPEDNGKVFFAKYMVAQNDRDDQYPRSGLSDRCHCPACGNNEVPLLHERKQPPILPVEGQVLAKKRPCPTEDNDTPVSRSTYTETTLGSQDTVTVFPTPDQPRPSPQTTVDRILNASFNSAETEATVTVVMSQESSQSGVKEDLSPGKFTGIFGGLKCGIKKDRKPVQKAPCR